MLKATERGRIVTDHEESPHIKSHDPSIIGSCKITRQTKTITILGYYNACLDGDLTWVASTHKVIESYNHVVLQHHVTN